MRMQTDTDDDDDDDDTEEDDAMVIWTDVISLRSDNNKEFPNFPKNFRNSEKFPNFGF
jgi:hypothetical protein